MNYLTNLVNTMVINTNSNEKIDNNLLESQITIINQDTNYKLISLNYKTLKEYYNIKNWKINLSWK